MPASTRYRTPMDITEPLHPLQVAWMIGVAAWIGFGLASGPVVLASINMGSSLAMAWSVGNACAGSVTDRAS